MTEQMTNTPSLLASSGHQIHTEYDYNVVRCPKCNSVFNKNWCTNSTCILYNTPTSLWNKFIKWLGEFDFERTFGRIRRTTPKDIYYNIKHRIGRPDLLPTGLSKTNWCDKVELMLYGIMRLVVDYIEKENGFGIVCGDNLTLNGKTFKDELTDLYVDWKVNYPALCLESEAALSLWAENHTMDFGAPNSRGACEVILGCKIDPVIQEQRWERLKQLEDDVQIMEQAMLHKAVELRQYLWS